MSYRTWTDEQLVSAIKTSKTISEVLRKIGLSSGSGNHQTVRNRIKNLNLDISHFSEVLFGKINSQEKDIKDVLVENSPYRSTTNLKKKLLKHKLLEEKCSKCSITHWNGQKLSLHLDHINGVRDDNRIENLRLLCPNCHSLRKSKTKIKYLKNKPCKCGVKIWERSEMCRKCDAKRNRGKHMKINYPELVTADVSNKGLLQMIADKNCVQVAKQLGVSDNSVRKRIRSVMDEERILEDTKIELEKDKITDKLCKLSSLIVEQELYGNTKYFTELSDDDRKTINKARIIAKKKLWDANSINHIRMKKVDEDNYETNQEDWKSFKEYVDFRKLYKINGESSTK